VRIPGAVIAFVVISAVVIGVFLVVDTGGAPVAWQPAAPVPALTDADIEGAVPAAATPATIEYVHDGDTLFLSDGTKVRLLGIDTPEIGEHLECYGDEATALLRSLLPEGTGVRVLADVQPLDQYGRSLLFIYTDSGELVNLTLIEAGAAEAVVLEPNVLFSSQLEAAEDIARASGVGMWGAC
jgi:micrococcal nuclease